jgi:hypothetical protein
MLREIRRYTNTHTHILSVCACLVVYIFRATKFRTLAPIIFSIIIAVFPSHIQNVYYFACKVKVTCYMQSMHRVELQFCRISTPALGADGWSATHPSRFTPRWKRQGTYCAGGRVGLGAVWMGPKNLLSTRVRSPDRPARKESLFRLNYSGPVSVHMYRAKAPENREVRRTLHDCGSSVWKLLHVTLLAPEIQGWLLKVWKICALLMWAFLLAVSLKPLEHFEERLLCLLHLL